MDKFSRVMIIDDNQIDRYIGERVIKKFSFADEVINVESAKDGLAYLTSVKNPDHLPHLIFLDINMPEMSGFEFLDEYGNLPEEIKKNCIIMMLTTSLNEEDRIKAEKNEFVYEFLNKPLSEEKLNKLKLNRLAK